MKEKSNNHSLPGDGSTLTHFGESHQNSRVEVSERFFLLGGAQ